MYDYGMLISYEAGLYLRARREASRLLKELGDPHPIVRRTLARGIMGVKTDLNPLEVIHRARALRGERPELLNCCLKWVPVERWIYSDMQSMKAAVVELRGRIGEAEKWRMTVEKRRYTLRHRSEIIRELAELIDRKVDLEKYDKELRVDILGKYAGLSVLERGDILSLAEL